MTNPASGAVGSQAAVGLFVLIPMLSEDNTHICLPFIHLICFHSPLISWPYTYLPLIHFHNLETWCPSGPFRFSQSRRASSKQIVSHHYVLNKHLLAVDLWFQILHYKSLHATICWTFFKRKNCYLWFQTLHSKSFHPTICWTHLGENLNCRQRS